MFDFLLGVSEAAAKFAGSADIPTEVETRSQCRCRRAVLKRRLIPLAGSAPVPFVSTSRQRSQKMLENAFDRSMYLVRWG